MHRDKIVEAQNTLKAVKGVTVLYMINLAQLILEG